MTEDEANEYLDEVMVEVTRDMVKHLNRQLYLSIIGVFWCASWVGVAFSQWVNGFGVLWGVLCVTTGVFGIFWLVVLYCSLNEWGEERDEMNRLKRNGMWKK